MSKSGKIMLCAIVAIAAVSTLFAVVPISGTFITSYIFTIIAICGIAGTVHIYDKKNSKEVAGLSYIYTSIIYAVLNMIFSIIACIISFTTHWTVVGHIVFLAVFAIRIITSSTGSDYVNEADTKDEEKHREFLNEKESYWK